VGNLYKQARREKGKPEALKLEAEKAKTFSLLPPESSSQKEH
jgi:hypothetical protein